MGFTNRLKTLAKRIKRDGVTLWFACRHPRSPWYVRLCGVLVVAYLLSPIDLIPDFIPLLGYLDDAVLLPVLIWLIIRLVPADVLRESRDQADQWVKSRGVRPTSRLGALLVVLLWALAGVALWCWWAAPASGGLLHVSTAPALR